MDNVSMLHESLHCDVDLSKAQCAAGKNRLVEIPVGEQGGRDKRPSVDEDAEPAGDHLHPHGRQVAVEVAQVVVGSEGVYGKVKD